jgi:hypothetical protein
MNWIIIKISWHYLFALKSVLFGKWKCYKITYLTKNNWCANYVALYYNGESS